MGSDATQVGARRRATQRDVAKAAGVSSAAVSYAFRGSAGVSEEVRQRILSVAKELGFRPNLAAQGLRLGRTNMIGLLLADITNPFYPELASAVVAGAAKKGAHVFLAQVGVEGAMQAEAARGLVDRGCDGLVFISVVPSDAALLREIREIGVPFVYANRSIDEVPADWVGIDDFAASLEVMRLLVESGRRRIAIIGGHRSSSVIDARVRGALAGLEEAGLRLVATELMEGSLSRVSGQDRMRQLMAMAPDVDAVLGGNDMVALGILDVATELGVQVPEQVAVVGFDDMSFASAGPLQLTTVSVPREAMGRRAVEMLFDRIDGYDGPFRKEIVPHQLQIRATAPGPRRS